MIEKLPSILSPDRAKAIDAAKGLPALICAFDKIEDGQRELSEDYSFCHRWVEQCGETIWICRDHWIAHTGQFDYMGRHANLGEAPAGRR
jgi:hypothetical protein